MKHEAKNLFLLSCLACLLTRPISLKAASEALPDPVVLIKASSDAISLTAADMEATLSIYDAKGNVRTRRIQQASRVLDGVTKTRLTFLSPADVAGTTLLIYDYPDKDDDMWIYLPALRNTRRIVSRDKGQSFMGSAFSNADLSKPALGDYTHVLTGAETLNGKDCWVVTSTCKTTAIAQSQGFAVKKAWIDKKTKLTQQLVFLNTAGQQTKILTLSDYKQLDDGTFMACRLEAKTLSNKRRSVLTVDALRHGSTLPASHFSSLSLDK